MPRQPEPPEFPEPSASAVVDGPERATWPRARGPGRRVASLTGRYPASTGALAPIRSELDTWLDDNGASREGRDQAALVLTELATNAIEHSAAVGCGAGDDTTAVMEVECRFDDHGAVSLAVTNRSGGAVLPPQGSWWPSDPLARRGRGLGIVAALSRSVEIEESPDSIRVAALVDMGL